MTPSPPLSSSLLPQLLRTAAQRRQQQQQQDAQQQHGQQQQNHLKQPQLGAGQQQQHQHQPKQQQLGQEELDLTRKGSVDVDPDAYPGQPELATPPSTAAPPSAAAAAAAGAGADAAAAAAGAAAAGAAPAAPPPPPAAAAALPTVLTKLQKWGDYEPFGQPVGPSHLVPMKTPLSEEILADWQLREPPRHALTVRALLAAQEAAGRAVGCIIDLSNHGEDLSQDSLERWRVD